MSAATESRNPARWRSPQPRPAANSAAPTAAVGTRTRTATTSTSRMPRLLGQRGLRPTARPRRGAAISHSAMAVKTSAKADVRIRSSTSMAGRQKSSGRPQWRGLPGYRLKPADRLVSVGPQFSPPNAQIRSRIGIGTPSSRRAACRPSNALPEPGFRGPPALSRPLPHRALRHRVPPLLAIQTPDRPAPAGYWLISGGAS